MVEINIRVGQATQYPFDECFEGLIRSRSELRHSLRHPQCYPEKNRSYPAASDLRICLGIGGEGQNRTVDTTIFSRMLYQLSYLATPVGSLRS